MAQFTPVDHDPFATAEGTNLVPVDHDPFAVEPQAKGKKPKDAKSADEAGVADYAMLLPRGFNRGLGWLLDTARLVTDATGASDVARSVGDAVGLPRYAGPQPGGKEWFEKTFNAGAKPVDTIAGRFIERVGEEVGAAAGPAAAILKAAGALKTLGSHAMFGPSRTLHNAAPAAPTLKNAVLAPIANAPGAALAGDVVATLGSGAGAGIAREAAPDSAWIEQVAQILGGGAAVGGMHAASTYGNYGPLGMLKKGYTHFFDKDAQTKQGEKVVKQLMGNELTPPVREALRVADDLSETIPGFKPSVAEASGAPSLIAQQTDLEKRLTGPDLNRIVARRQDNIQAVDQFAADAAPKAPNSPQYVMDVARGRVTALQEGVERQQATVQGRRQMVAESAFPNTDRVEQGARLRAQLSEERGARSDAISAMATRLGINDVDLTAPFTQASRAIVSEFKPTSVFEDLKNYPEVLNVIRTAGQPIPGTPARASAIMGPDGLPIQIPGTPDQPARITFKDMKALRERVSDDLIDAVGGANPSAKKVRMLTMLKESVDGMITRLTETAAPDLAPQYAAFRRAYFEDYIRPFEQGAALKVRNRTGQGFYRTQDEKVADAFFRPGGVSDAEQFNTIFANRPEAHAALRASVLDRMNEAVVRDGVLDHTRLTAWLRRHEGVLQRFPQLARELRDPIAADTALLQRQTQLAGRQRAIEDSMLARAVGTWTRGGTADAAIDAALADPRKMVQLMGAARREDGALDALRRNVWDKATGGDAPAILTFIRDHSQSLSRLFSPGHLRDIESIAIARAMIDRVPTPQGAAYVPRPMEWLERMIGQGLPQLSSRIFALKTGRVQKGYVAIDTSLKALRGRAQVAADDAFKGALYNSQIARDMADMLDLGSTSVAKARQLHSRIFALGLPLLDREPQEQD